MSANVIALSYLAASVLFILSLRGLSHPLTARRGNVFGIVGMSIAVAATLAITRRIDIPLAMLAGRRRRGRRHRQAGADDADA